MSQAQTEETPTGIPWRHRTLKSSLFEIGAVLCLILWIILEELSNGQTGLLLPLLGLVAAWLMRASRSAVRSTTEPAPQSDSQKKELKSINNLSRALVYSSLIFGALILWFLFDSRADPNRFDILYALLAVVGMFAAVRLWLSARSTRLLADLRASGTAGTFD